VTAQSEQANVPKAADSSQIVSGVTDIKVGPTPTDLNVQLDIVPSQPGATTRFSVCDLTYGDSAKAMVEEVIWNMEIGDYEVYRAALAQGKSPAEAARAAGGQLAVIHRKIADYTLKLQAVLSESKARISVEETIDKPLEQIMMEIIGDGTMSDLYKDSFVLQLGALQEWVKHGLQGDMTPLQANRIALSIGDRLNWGRTTSVSDDLKAVYRDMYSSLKTAICAAAPGAQNLHDRLTNLYAAKSDIDQPIFALRGRSLAKSV
jgi:hypothetical protein